jgi:plastocyanin
MKATFARAAGEPGRPPRRMTPAWCTLPHLQQRRPETMTRSNRTATRLSLASLIAATAFLVAACGGAAATTSPTTAPTTAPTATSPSAAPSAAPSTAAGGGAASAQIANFAFAPANLTVKVGGTVTWTNTDGATHTVTANDGSFDSGSLATGATFSQTFAKAGTYTYACAIHASMTGTITVTP